jgi:hypothetical protein
VESPTLQEPIEKLSPRNAKRKGSETTKSPLPKDPPLSQIPKRRGRPPKPKNKDVVDLTTSSDIKEVLPVKNELNSIDGTVSIQGTSGSNSIDKSVRSNESTDETTVDDTMQFYQLSPSKKYTLPKSKKPTSPSPSKQKSPRRTRATTKRRKLTNDIDVPWDGEILELERMILEGS